MHEDFVTAARAAAINDWAFDNDVVATAVWLMLKTSKPEQSPGGGPPPKRNRPPEGGLLARVTPGKEGPQPPAPTGSVPVTAPPLVRLRRRQRAPISLRRSPRP